MKYVTYYETVEIVSEQESTNAYNKLKDENKEIKKEIELIERYHFTSSVEGGVKMPEYSICHKNKESLYLEKTSMQGKLFWRECEEITQEEGLRMKKGDLEWMKDDGRHLVRDFYLQMTLNCLVYDYCESYLREEYGFRKNDKIVFNRNVRRIRGNYVMECLPAGFVQVRIRRAKTIPRLIQGMMQGLEFTEEIPVYA